ncbi:MAG: hypothetical protein QG602_13 [Verrucomicrobiota bacterium]|nr:hypothetical protein [Verrucomicrobiota bacterium]
MKNILLLGALLTVPAMAAPPASAPRPNVLVILVDDLGWTDLGAYGATLAETPHLDRLAAEGARFTTAYVAYPRCVPSRFGLMTGKHPTRFQGARDGMKLRPGRDTTIGHVFSAAGYDTFYCGKWHLGEGPSGPAALGFKTAVAAGGAGATRSHFAPYTEARGRGGESEKELIHGLEDAPRDEYLADRQTDETMKFLGQARDQPFFAVLAFYAVHTPLEAKAEHVAHYQAKLAGQPKPEAVWEKERHAENLLVQNNPVYGGMVRSVDENVGRLLAELDRLGLSRDTIVVVLSDHGGLSARGNTREVATSNRPLRAGKGHLYEGGLRIPLLVRWPGRVAPAVIGTPVISLDLIPTLADLTQLGTPLPQDLDGRSIAPLLGGGTVEPRPFFWHNPAPRPASTGDLYSSAVRSGEWKLLEFPESGQVELYDLSNDVGESRNLAAEQPQKRDELLAALKTWRNAVGAAPARSRPAREAKPAKAPDTSEPMEKDPS